MLLNLHHFFTIIDVTFQKYGFYPLQEQEMHIIRSIVAAEYLNQMSIPMFLDRDYDPAWDIFIAVFDAAFFVRGIAGTCIIAHGDQRS